MPSFPVEFPEMYNGPVKPLTPDEEAKDKLGYTHPNLHRRITTGETYRAPGEILPRKYYLGLHGVCSIRVTETTVHSESAIDEEIP